MADPGSIAFTWPSILAYRPVSSILQEVKDLRTALESGRCPDVDSAVFYNVKTMKLERNPGPYRYLAR